MHQGERAVVDEPVEPPLILVEAEDTEGLWRDTGKTGARRSPGMIVCVLLPLHVQEYASVSEFKQKHTELLYEGATEVSGVRALATQDCDSLPVHVLCTTVWACVCGCVHGLARLHQRLLSRASPSSLGLMMLYALF